MAEVFSAVRTYVLADAGIAAVIGARFYPIKAPQNAQYPLVTMQQIAEVRFPHLRGSSELAAPRYQIDAWAKESGGTAAFRAAQQLGELIRDRLDGFAGLLTDATVSPDETYQVAIIFNDERDLFETDQALGGFYRRSTDYVIWHKQVVGS